MFGWNEECNEVSIYRCWFMNLAFISCSLSLYKGYKWGFEVNVLNIGKLDFEDGY